MLSHEEQQSREGSSSLDEQGSGREKEKRRPSSFYQLGDIRDIRPYSDSCSWSWGFYIKCEKVKDFGRLSLMAQLCL